jgi:flagellin-like hook-associated protein FlgL
VLGAGGQNWTMAGIARSINQQIELALGGSPGLKGLSASIVDSEVRLTYEKPASASATVGNTIRIANATTNAAPIGLVDGTYSGFVDGKKNLDQAKWGFSNFISSITYGVDDLTVVHISVSDGINSTEIDFFTSNATAFATSPDMVLFTEFQAITNRVLENASVAVRVDQIGGAMAFTSLRVGSENINTATITSMVAIKFTGTNTLFGDKFGLNEGASKGSGDTNFKLHIVDRQSQFQIGADQGQTMSINIANMGAKALGIENLDLTNVDGANDAMGRLNAAIDRVSSERSKLGSYNNRLEYSINNLRNTYSNLTASESRIRDADIAMEMIEFTRNQIVQQSGTAMLAQANSVPQGVLQLLK